MSSQPNYPPWEGKLYSSGGTLGIRLVLLGESLFEWRPGALNDKDIQTQLIGEVSRDEWRNPYYTKVFQVVMGQSRKNSLPAAFEEFWQSVVFYNYIQSPAGTGPRQSPVETAWANSREAFEYVIEKCKPDAVLMLCKNLWQRLVGLGLVRPVEGSVAKLAVGAEPLTAYVNHPSSGSFSSTKWSPRVAESLVCARANIPPLR